MRTLHQYARTASGLFCFVVASVLGSYQALGQCETAELLPATNEHFSQFGQALAINGDIAVVGCPLETVSAQPVAGAAHVFQRRGSAWVEIQQLQEAVPTTGHGFGDAVAMDQGTLIIGCHADPWGVAYVYAWSGTQWSHEGTLDAGYVGGVGFGAEASLRGDRLAIGSGYRVFVFERTGGEWQLVAVFEPTFPTPSFARLSIAGDILAVGSPEDSKVAPRSGMVYVFRRIAGVWQYEAPLFPPDLVTDSYYGESVAVDGDAIAAGAFGVEAAYLFRFEGGAWVEEAKLQPDLRGIDTFFGKSIALRDDVCVVGATLERKGPFRAGAIHRFVRRASGWFDTAVMTSSDGGSYEHLGHSVAFSGDSVLSGSPDHHHPGLDDSTGGAYIFEFTPGMGGHADNYGAGWPGTNGVPAIGLVGNPILCSNPILTLGNSRGVPTIGWLVVGNSSAASDIGLGGTLLVEPQLFVALGLPGAGLELPAPLPCDPSLAGAIVYAQVLERDPGASRQVSFSRGLAVELGVCP